MVYKPAWKNNRFWCRRIRQNKSNFRKNIRSHLSMAYRICRKCTCRRSCKKNSRNRRIWNCSPDCPRMRYRCRRSWLRRSRKYKKPASRCNRDSLCRKYTWNNCCMKRSRRYRTLTTRRSRDWFCIRCIGRMNCKSCIRKCMILKKPYIRDEPYRNCNFRHKRFRRVRFRRCSLNCYI